MLLLIVGDIDDDWLLGHGRGRGLHIVDALVVLVSYLSRSGNQPAGSRDEISTCTLRKHLVVFVEGTDGGLKRTP